MLTLPQLGGPFWSPPMLRFFAALAALIVAHCALAGTTIPGGNIIDQTWTPDGNPYFIQGDITIPAGSTLTIQPGVIIDFNVTDSMAAGLDPTLVEITVQGSLIANGTAAQPINFRGSSSSSGAWYGIIVDTGANACFVSHAALWY